MKLSFKDIFDSFAADSEKTWAYDRNQTVGASEVFDCIRKIYYRKVGVPTGQAEQDEADPENPESWGAKRRGDILEKHYVVPAVQNFIQKVHGLKLRFAGSTQKTLIHNRNSATPDGLITGLDKDALADYGIADIEADCIVLEIKSVDPRVNIDNAKEIHVGQTNTQIALIRQKTAHKPVYGVILYVDASFLDRIKVHVIKYRDEDWLAAEYRANAVFSAKSAIEMMPEGRFMKRACTFCEFTSACMKDTISSIPLEKSDKEINAVSDEVMDLITPAALALKAASEKRKESDLEYEKNKTEIKVLLRKLGFRKMRSRKADPVKWAVSWYSQAGKKSLDRKAIIDALGVDDLEDFMVQGEGFDQVRIT